MVTQFLVFLFLSVYMEGYIHVQVSERVVWKARFRSSVGRDLPSNETNYQQFLFPHQLHQNDAGICS